MYMDFELDFQLCKLQKFSVTKRCGISMISGKTSHTILIINDPWMHESISQEKDLMGPQ
jgi:hypothetical protein